MTISQSSLLAVFLSAIAIVAIPAGGSSLTRRDISGELNTHIGFSLNDKIFPPPDTSVASLYVHNLI
jgi:hypothetical protein